ncbi:MAG: methyltransferase family protein [Candidatus Baldrarchaeia archaeon]
MMEHLRKMVSNIVSTLLMIVQHIPVVGPWYGIMTIPIVIYFATVLLVHPEFIFSEFSLLFFSWHFILGKVVFLAGLAIFLLALSNFRKRTTPISTYGLYSKIRHPQYLGLTIVTLGFTLMSIEWKGTTELLGVWLISLIGYMLLAYSEEKHLLKKHYRLYKQYMEKTHFMLPMNPPKNLPEPLFTTIFMLGFALLCSLIATII